MSKETEPSEEIKKDELNTHDEGQAGANDQNNVSADENQIPGEEAQEAASNEVPEALTTNLDKVEADDDEEKIEDTVQVKQEEDIEQETVVKEPQETAATDNPETPVTQVSETEATDPSAEDSAQEKSISEEIVETSEITEEASIPQPETTVEMETSEQPSLTETPTEDSISGEPASAQPEDISAEAVGEDPTIVAQKEAVDDAQQNQTTNIPDNEPEKTSDTPVSEVINEEQSDQEIAEEEKTVNEADSPEDTIQSAQSENEDATSADDTSTSGEAEIGEVKAEEEASDIKPETTAESSVDEVVASDEKKAEGGTEAPSGIDELATTDHEEEIHDDGDELVHADYTQYSKEELVRTIKKLTKLDDFKKLDVVLNTIAPLFQKLKEDNRAAALEKYIAEGGSKEDFSYKNELDQRYDAYYKLIKERKHKYYGDLGRQKLENYQKATELLEKLRHLVDGEESTTSINAIKEIQEEWKSTGQVPPQHVRNLWASYNALMDRFYDNRSIYFELKELDRKKNLTAKEELCVRAEKLEQEENLRHAIKELNELHNEYKHVGPVPKVRQEALWQRFKAASDNIYARRKTHYDELKKDLDVNLEAKAKLKDEVQAFAEFDSDRIVEWNKKTQEILDIQKRWEAIGGLPRERAHEVNKPFWSAFKRFFNNKNGFFKKLEGERVENMNLKEQLVAKANELKDSTDWNQTANELKKLQNDWRDIGPVPEKHRNEVYQRFKQACDVFFENRRNSFKVVEKGYEENLKLKEEVCQKILKLSEEGNGDIGELEVLQEEWNSIGFVPKNAIRSSQEMFAKAVDTFITNSSLDVEEKAKLKITTKLTSLKGTPNANRKLNKKEFNLRRQITNLENDISLWKNNLEFFANSKNADQVRQEFDLKIDNAKKELMELKEQLKIIRNI